MHVNTLLLQDILSEEKWQKRLTDADRRGLPRSLPTRRRRRAAGSLTGVRRRAVEGLAKGEEAARL
ncbi:hypothetical protein JBE27_08275 [Streptomyces albiflaviniger]|nr:hypothetical protein [Streptomyces albiflaviniger]